MRQPAPEDHSSQLAGTASLTSAKESRKRAELDAQLLANRLALLKQEEQKAWKKIEETRKRAAEISDTRRQNEAKFEAKEQFYKDKWETVRTAQTVNTQKRVEGQATRVATKQALLDNKSSTSNAQKLQSRENLAVKKDREAMDCQANVARSDYIKQRKEEGRKKLEDERLAKLESTRDDYEARMAEEELLRSRTDALVARMEREEMELIERLQNTQTVQRNAYEELESALGQTSKQISTSAGGRRMDPAA